MSDSDDRPRRRMMSQDERDRDGLRARRERERRDQLDELADVSECVPERSDDDPTRPTDLVQAELDESPAMSAIWRRLDRHATERRRGNKDTADRLLEALGKRPPNERFVAIETRLKIMIAILVAVGTAALGALVTVAKGLYERGETDGAHEQRLQSVERELRQFEQLFPSFQFQTRSKP